MNKGALRKIFNKISSHAPAADVDGCRPSRRIQGLLNNYAEGHRYRAIMCYIQKGLGFHEETVAKIIEQIIKFQNPSYSGRSFHFCFFSFGWNNHTLRHAGKSILIKHTPIGSTKYRDLAKKLCELAGSDGPSTSPLISELFPDTDVYSRISRVTSEDLPVFFCSNRDVKISATLSSTYKAIRRKALWIFLDDEEPQWEFGKFTPEFQ